MTKTKGRILYEQALAECKKRFPSRDLQKEAPVSSDDPDYQYVCEIYDSTSWRNCDKSKKIDNDI